MRNRLADFYRTVRDRCEEFVMILAYALDDGPIESAEQERAFIVAGAEEAVRRIRAGERGNIHVCCCPSMGPPLPGPCDISTSRCSRCGKPKPTAVLADAEELQSLVALFPRCTECGEDVEPADWNARRSPSRKNRVAHVACPFSSEVPDDGEW